MKSSAMKNNNVSMVWYYKFKEKENTKKQA